MLVDPIMSLWSDRLFQGAVVVYLIALLVHAAEYVVGRSPSLRAAAPVAAGAGSASGSGSVAVATPPEGVTVGPVGDDSATSDESVRGRRSRADRYGRMAVSLTVLGVLVHLASMVARGLAVSRWPLGNMYEFTSALCLLALVSWLVALRRIPTIRTVGVFVLAPVLILMFLAGTVLYAQAAPVVPALQSYWLIIHVTTITLGSGLLLVPGVASVLFLMRRSGRPARLVARLPSADVLDRIAYRVTVVGFPIYTFAVICGAIWAEAAWGRFWGWDPKETVAFVAWVIYAAYLHARATAGWRTTRAAWINAAGFATILFNLFFINMVVAGLHSYAGL
ncbi:c-type cytochrome biogenesis protein CcsB [Pseudonocardia sp. KRD291]|uniref:c-type cytochrome biogenesis protein CcsB n=1 Tax=Pseudonocardia sp. KRD291 TaxID=2792007 RepID=UPI001C4A1D74|nr:c-type cytochrome biogenesis protein CcsB [Pseudonocardia sp. KRD291]MBW0103401.1 c-type cytochrome biogenesis protein CcsB [Pseudonocardia sp. KRD291]